jgi:hypothetical protein
MKMSVYMPIFRLYVGVFKTALISYRLPLPLCLKSGRMGGDNFGTTFFNSFLTTVITFDVYHEYSAKETSVMPIDSVYVHYKPIYKKSSCSHSHRKNEVVK